MGASRASARLGERFIRTANGCLFPRWQAVSAVLPNPPLTYLSRSDCKKEIAVGRSMKGAITELGGMAGIGPLALATIKSGFSRCKLEISAGAHTAIERVSPSPSSLNLLVRAYAASASFSHVRRLETLWMDGYARVCVRHAPGSHRCKPGGGASVAQRKPPLLNEVHGNAALSLRSDMDSAS